MSEFRPAMVSSALQKAFDKIGRQNSTAPPVGGDNKEPYLHEKFVSDRLLSTAKKRKEAADKAIIENNIVAASDIDNVGHGESAVLASSKYYSFTVEKKNPSMRLNERDLGENIIEVMASKGAMMSHEEVASLIKRSKRPSKAATTLKVVPINGVN